MSIHKQILEAQNYLDTMRDLYDMGLVSREAVAKARRELGELCWERDVLAPQPERQAEAVHGWLLPWPAGLESTDQPGGSNE